jgi:lipoate-protein ligase A
MATPPAAKSWFVFRSGAGGAARNMAWDTALLEAAPVLGRPVLRFYGWTEPAASFGYFQKYAEAERMTELRPLVRRPTGGGVVPHDADWTYSLVFPPTDEWQALNAVESYRRVHEWICAALLRLNIKAEVAPAGRKELPGQCFAGHEKSDVLWQGRKIAGAAQRRTRTGLLIQGSVQPPHAKFSRDDWERTMCESARLNYGVAWQDFETNAVLERRVEEFTDKTYSQPAYNQRR